MTQFSSITDESLQRVGERIIRNAQHRMMSQVPIPSRNPFATGALQRSVRFNWSKTEEGAWSLAVEYIDYGKFTNFGTRAYFDAGARDAGFFGREFQGYKKGKGGVRPQEWTSLRGDQPVYEAIVEAELRISWETFINNTFSNLSKNKEE